MMENKLEVNTIKTQSDRGKRSKTICHATIYSSVMDLMYLDIPVFTSSSWELSSPSSGPSSPFSLLVPSSLGPSSPSSPSRLHAGPASSQVCHHPQAALQQ